MLTYLIKDCEGNYLQGLTCLHIDLNQWKVVEEIVKRDEELTDFVTQEYNVYFVHVEGE